MCLRLAAEEAPLPAGDAATVIGYLALLLLAVDHCFVFVYAYVLVRVCACVLSADAAARARCVA